MVRLAEDGAMFKIARFRKTIVEVRLGLRKFSFSLADTEEKTVLITRKNAGVLT
jgi:hypothetical protein